MPKSRLLQTSAMTLALALAAVRAEAQTVQTPPPQEDDAGAVEEVVVTAPYSAREAVTGTKTDTPLIEVPQSVAVVSRELIEERRPATLLDALYNVSGVVDAGQRRGFDNIIIRGFTASTSVYLDGLRVERGNQNVQQEPYGLERIEVLKGPGSVLFGQGSLGGIVSLVSKSPTNTPRYGLDLTVGSYGAYQGAVDLSGPLTADGDVSGRLVALYRAFGDSIDFNDKDRIYVSPSLRWSNGDTSIILRGNYTHDEHEATYVGVPLEGSILPNFNGRIARSRYIGEPDNDGVDVERHQAGYEAEHRFNDSWRVRQNLRYSDTDVVSKATFSSGLNADQRTLRRGTAIFAQTEQALAVDTNGEFRFDLGRLRNTVLVGADLLFQEVDQTFDFGSFPPWICSRPSTAHPAARSFRSWTFNRATTFTASTSRTRSRSANG